MSSQRPSRTLVGAVLVAVMTAGSAASASAVPALEFRSYDSGHAAIPQVQNVHWEWHHHHHVCGDVPLCVEIGEAGVTELRAYAATVVGSRAGCLSLA